MRKMTLAELRRSMRRAQEALSRGEHILRLHELAVDGPGGPLPTRTFALLATLAAFACGSNGSSTHGEPVALLDYQATVPSSFVSRPASTSMRLAEWSVPGTDGMSAEVIVYYFGEGQGGSAEANIERWRSQFTSAEGGPVTPDVETLDDTAFRTTVAEFEGSYARAVGATAAPAEADQALVAAVVETPRGNLFLQLFGDRAAVANARGDFLEMVGSIRG